MTENILSYDVECRSDKEIVRDIFTDWDASRPTKWLACLNPHSYVTSCNNAEFSESLHAADWLIPDGVGVVLASKIMGGGLEGRVTGFDIFTKTMTQLNKVAGRVFFLGSTEETLEMIRDRIVQDYPNIHLAGLYSPPFRVQFSSQETDAIVAAINVAQPDILWVGMTAPKQEIWIYTNQGRLNVQFAGAIGAVFDFYAGQVKRSPAIFQKMGLEWLHRSLVSPKRLGKRNIKSNPIFIADVIRAKFKRFRG